MKNKVFNGITVFFSACLMVSTVLATTLEEQFEGLSKCDFKQLNGIYLDQYSNKVNLPKSSYFAENKLEPCELNDLAFYCVNDKYYGLDVEKIAIPYTGGLTYYALYFNHDVASAKKQLNQYINVVDKMVSYDLEDNSLKSPTLVSDKDNSNKSILICDFYSE